MNPALLNALLIFGVVAGMLVLLKTISIIAAKFGIEPELKRKIAHVATGVATLPFPWIFPKRWPVIVILVLALGAMAMLRSKLFAGKSMNTVLHDVQRKSYGEFYLLFAIGFLFMVSYGTPVLFVLPVAIIALSDTASALVGTKYGQKHLAIAGGQKSVEGVIAFFVVTLIVSLITLMLMTDLPDVNVILLSVLISGFCAYVERDSWRGLDNIFVPIGAILVLAKFLPASPAVIVLGMAVIAGVFIAMRLIAPLLQITRHAARAFGILIVLILCTTEAHNAILPVMAIAAHLFARASHPAKGRNRDLEMITVTASIAMIWLFAGAFSPNTTINLFALTYAGAAIIFAGLAFRNKLRWLCLGFIPILAAVYAFVISLNPAQAKWGVDPMILGGAALVLPILSVLLAPAVFDRYRSVKAFAIAMIVPMAFYLTVGFIL